jgi:RHS repeat-associated protein
VRTDSSGGGSKQYSSLSDTVNFAFEKGNKSFELSNHLGNVLATLSDMPLGKDITGSDTLAEYYVAVVHSAQFYYDFGWGMPDRGFEGSLGYAFGFNGKMNDKDWGGQLIQDYGFRLYNPSIGKFLSFDPLAPDYPELTPYQFASNTPINSIDLDGLEKKESYTVKDIGDGYKITIGSSIDGLGTNIPSNKQLELVAPPLKEGQVRHSIPLMDYMWQKFSGTNVTEDGQFYVDQEGYKSGVAPKQFIFEDPFGVGPKNYSKASNAIKYSIERAGKLQRYKLGPNDLNWRGTGKTYKEALDEAFKRTGLPREEFIETKWAHNKNGKTIPVEYKHSLGAEVNIDYRHINEGPDAPHIGYQTSGKRSDGGGKRGHIILDEVPAGRIDKKE